MCTVSATRCISKSSIEDSECDCTVGRPTMDVWLTCSGSEPSWSCGVQLLMCVVSSVKTAKFVGDAVGGLGALSPDVEDIIRGSPFAHEVERESSCECAWWGNGCRVYGD
jgi:hypothetical protein